MRPRLRAQLLSLLAFLLAAATSAPAQSLTVWFTSPSRGEPSFGEVVVEAEVRSEAPLLRVEFFLDGERVGAVVEPPYRIVVNVGSENRDRRFDVEVENARGEVATAMVVSRAIRVDLETDVRLQELYVTVSDGDDRVLFLRPEDFTILDGGAPQEIVAFATGEVSVVATILVDASLSMRGAPLRSALRGAGAFIRGLQADDKASIVLFSDRLLHATPFTNDARSLGEGLVGVTATGGTALNDQIYLALKRLEQQLGRRVLILLTDGIDTHSTLRTDEVRWLAQRSRTIIYWIRTEVMQPDELRYSSWKGPERYRREYTLLGRTVEESGGRIVNLRRYEDAEQAFQQIFKELREQYILGYQPSEVRADGSWRRIQVRVDRPDLRVRAPMGYIDQ